MYHQLYFLPPLSCFHAHLLALSHKGKNKAKIRTVKWLACMLSVPIIHRRRWARMALTLLILPKLSRALSCSGWYWGSTGLASLAASNKPKSCMTERLVVLSLRAKLPFSSELPGFLHSSCLLAEVLVCVCLALGMEREDLKLDMDLYDLVMAAEEAMEARLASVRVRLSVVSSSPVWESALPAVMEEAGAPVLPPLHWV